ncbi:MAG: FKBP-type peptidyl-prolyl cis-trans isomerase [Dehalococcoidia bacterium]|nr:FKBP-type peptidyl-prolyl cis-trans isomerase [Dehalococcoidia bacterium]
MKRLHVAPRLPVMLLALAACGGADDDSESSDELFDTEAATTTESGLMYTEEATGDGAVAEPQDTVVVHYTGMLTDGTEFDSSHSRGEPSEFSLNGVIPGFAEGIVGMAEGGQRTLYIPSDLAYGEQGNGPIPGGADLIFEVELIEVIR